MGQRLSRRVQSCAEYFIELKVSRLMDKVKPEDCRQWDTYEYEGVAMYPDVLPKTLDDLKTFKIRDNDVFIVSYPKAGTTWTQEIMSCVLHDGNVEEINKKHTAFRAPFLEMTVGGTVHKDLPRTHTMIGWLPRSSPRLIKSHLQGQLLPHQVWEKKIKIIYVIRNPKDLATSYFHHCQLLNPHLTLDWDDFFSRFHSGTIGFGKWWVHYLYFWERRNEDHILLLRYEEMTKDLRGTVERISVFLGKSFSNDVINVITSHCTFDNMKKNPMTNPDTMINRIFGKQEGRSFMRKGAVGDWKGHLSESQSEAIDDLCRETFAGTGLVFN